MSDPRFNGKTSLNGCSGCRLDFASLAAFDRHRIGRQEYDFSAERLDGRRCMDEGEMIEAGMELDRRGRWTIAKSESERERLMGLRRFASAPTRVET